VVVRQESRLEGVQVDEKLHNGAAARANILPGRRRRTRWRRNRLNRQRLRTRKVLDIQSLVYLVRSDAHAPVARMLLALGVLGCHFGTRVDTGSAIQFF
jgi:hypothetical protein